MKKIFLFCALIMTIAATFAQDSAAVVTSAVATLQEQPTSFSDAFNSLALFIPLVVFLTSLITNHTPTLKGWVKQGLSWVIAILASLFAWYFKFGMFDGITWYYALCVALAAGLAANGLFDVKAVQSILSVFTLRKRV